MRKLYFCLLFFVGTVSVSFGQCNILANAVAGIFLDYQSTNLLNCSGVAFNPIQAKYYAVRAGNPGFPLETWSSSGAQLYSTFAGFDWRGMWWNPNTNQLEGNGYASSGIWRADIDANGWALNTGANIFNGMAQPDAQSCGDYDPVANEIVYYFSGRIYRYSRATNAAINNYPLVGCPVSFSNLNTTSVIYTGCPGKEIGVLDYVLKRIYIFQKNTGIYVGMSQLPPSSVPNFSFRFSWANGFAWLFDLSSGNWFSYRIFDVILPELSFQTNAIWVNPALSQIDWGSADSEQFDRFEVERSVDGANFQTIGSQEAIDGQPQNSGSTTWALQDATAPNSPVLYYRIKALLKSGDIQTSDVMLLTRSDQPGLNLAAWPVPANDAIHIRFDHAVAGSSIDVVDAAGKSVYHQAVTEELENAGGLQLQTEAWAAGIYHLQLRDLVGHVAMQRLVIQH